MRRLMRAGLALIPAALMLTSGCMAQAQDARQAAAALAEAVYPGRLEVIRATTRVGFDYGQDVVLGVRGDPVTRIRLSVDKDPSQCRVRTPCETRLREAYAFAIPQAEEVRALERAFRSCGVALLAVSDVRYGITPDRPASVSASLVVETPLDQGAEPATARLTTCMDRYAAERPQTPWATRDVTLGLRVLPQGRRPAAAPAPLTFEAEIPRSRWDQPAYALTLSRRDTTTTPTAWRLHAYPTYDARLKDDIERQARRWLRSQGAAARLQPGEPVRPVALASGRLDAVRAEVGVCSGRGSGPCRPDQRVRLTYDLSTGQASNFELVAAR